jgi:hypothetical protein
MFSRKTIRVIQKTDDWVPRVTDRKYSKATVGVICQPIYSTGLRFLEDVFNIFDPHHTRPSVHRTGVITRTVADEYRTASTDQEPTPGLSLRGAGVGF